jgi:hypothetical protein
MFVQHLGADGSGAKVCEQAHRRNPLPMMEVAVALGLGGAALEPFRSARCTNEHPPNAAAQHDKNRV